MRESASEFSGPLLSTSFSCCSENVKTVFSLQSQLDSTASGGKCVVCSGAYTRCTSRTAIFRLFRFVVVLRRPFGELLVPIAEQRRLCFSVFCMQVLCNDCNASNCDPGFLGFLKEQTAQISQILLTGDQARLLCLAARWRITLG